MRIFGYFVVAFASLAPDALVAQKFALPNPLVTSGESFVDPVYDSHNASRLHITHKTGAASIPIENLPSALRDKVGYNPVDARIAEEALERSQQEAMAQSQIEQHEMWVQEKAAERKREEALRKAAPAYAVTFTRSKTAQTYSSRPSSPPRKLSYKEEQARKRLEYYQGMDGSIDRASAMASREEKEAYIAQEVRRGNLPSSELPEAYGGRPKRGTQRSRQMQLSDNAESIRMRGGVPFDPAIFPAGTAPVHAHPLAAAGGDPHVHRMWHGADGSSATQQGNVLFHSDGRMSHGAFPAGGQLNTFHSSDGSVHHQSGNAMFPAGGGAGMFGAP
jgi:hypothetical protein